MRAFGVSPSSESTRAEEKPHACDATYPATELTARILNGATIFGPAQERVGHVCALQGGGAQARVMVDLRDSRRPVSLPLSELSFSRDAGQGLRADARWTRAELQCWSVPES